MGKKMKAMIGCVITICLTIYLLGNLTDLMERKSSDYKYADFFSQEENFDVLFMGTSHVVNGIYPMELWNDYGIVSYNLGGYNSLLPTIYWVMENSLEYTRPKVIVIDCFTLESNVKSSVNFSWLHLSLDAFRTTPAKIAAIWDILDDEYMDDGITNGEITLQGDEPRTKIGLLWDYSVYHSRWNEINADDFDPGRNLEKGAESKIGVTKGNIDRIDPDLKLYGGTVGEQYLRKIIEDCQSRDIEVLLTYLPSPGTGIQQKASNYVYDLAEEYGVNYINFLDTNIINYSTDFYDEWAHLNPSGARKVAAYLGKYLTENYNIEDQRTNGAYSDWNQDYEEYEVLKNDYLKQQTDLFAYLMLLSNDDVEVILDIRDKSIFDNETFAALLENVGVNIDEVGDSTDFILIEKGGEKTVVLNDFREDGAYAETELGATKLSYDSDGTYYSGEKGYYGIYVDDALCLEADSNEDISMQIVTYRNGLQVDNVKFNYIIDEDTNEVYVLTTGKR